MRRSAWLALACALLAAPVGAQTPETFESITVANTSIGITGAIISPAGGPQMRACEAQLETAEIRYRTDGTAPTTSEGTLLEPGDVLPLYSADEATRARFIRTGATSGVLKVRCWFDPRAALRQSGSSNVLAVVPGTGATALGKAEDAAATTGDTGVFTLGVIDSTNATQRGATADYAQFTVDHYGTQLFRADHPNRFHCTVTVSTATTVQAVGNSCAAPGAGLSLYVTDIMFAASAAGIAADAFPTLKYGTGGTCGSGTAVFWQALTAAAIVAIDNRSIPIKIPANNEICWISTTAGSKSLQISGFIAP